VRKDFPGYQEFHFITPAEWDVHMQEGGFWEPQCTILTRKGAWCKNPIFHGQIHSYWGEDNERVVRLRDWQIIQAGMCATHRRLDG